MSSHYYARMVNDQINCWSVPKIWELVNGLPVTKISVEYASRSFTKYFLDFDDEDWVRVREADLSYPIITVLDYGIVDGCHRIVKAMIECRNTISAHLITISDLGTPDLVFDTWEEYDNYFNEEKSNVD